MKTMTIRGVDEHLADALRKIAQKEHQSMNQTIIHLLKEGAAINALDSLKIMHSILWMRCRHRIMNSQAVTFSHLIRRFSSGLNKIFNHPPGSYIPPAFPDIHYHLVTLKKNCQTFTF